MSTTAADAELAFYERFFFERELEPYPVQEQAFEHIFAGRDVLVTVPTGTGKTMMAKGAIAAALAQGKTIAYTTPLRALTEEKFRELSEDFGEDNVGFATGDYKVNGDAPVQVLVAEILWNQVYGEQRQRAPFDVVVMDEGHYFNDPERGYVWEQTIIGLHPTAQLIVLSATVGQPQAFCQWAYITRGVKMELVRSDIRKVPLVHRFEEAYLVETAKELFANQDVPALVFTFGRNLCFERGRLLRSCPRFITDEEREEVKARIEGVLLPTGQGPELEKLLLHGIGIHHAGILPAYRRLVEELTVDRLLKFVVTTETIAAGINLPAKRVVFPSLRKYIQGQARLLLPAEYHQMAGRAGRPQYDTEGIAITLAPEEVVQEFRKEIKDAKKRGRKFDENQIKQKFYNRALTEARAKKDVTWNADLHQKLVDGEPAELKSATKITAEQILAVGLPDLEQEALPGEVLLAEEAARLAEQEAAEAKKKAEEEAAAAEALKAALAAGEVVESDADPAGDEAAAESEANTAEEETGAESEANTAEAEAAKKRVVRAKEDLPPVKVAGPTDAESRRLDIATVIEHLLTTDQKKREMHRNLACITRNLQALDVLNSHGRQIDGWIIGKIRGVDGLFSWYVLQRQQLEPEYERELLEFLIQHHAIQRIFEKREREIRRQWILARLRERRADNPQLTFEDVEEDYFREHPPELSQVELHHRTFTGITPHPELHGGKVQKAIWAEMDDEDLTFSEYVDKHELGREEGSLFTYLARVMKCARMLAEVSGRDGLSEIETKIRNRLGAIDPRVLEGFW